MLCAKSSNQPNEINQCIPIAQITNSPRPYDPSWEKIRFKAYIDSIVGSSLQGVMQMQSAAHPDVTIAWCSGERRCRDERGKMWQQIGSSAAEEEPEEEPEEGVGARVRWLQ
jgi:ribosomal protein L12E/L44/L45/RPP1/RPP2